MPSALETLVKVLKLEQNTNFQDKAVIGGLASFAGEWANGAHEQARKPEHHALVDELAGLMRDYHQVSQPDRGEAIRYMLGRIMGRVPPSGSSASIQSTPTPPPVAPAPQPSAPPPRQEARTEQQQPDQRKNTPKPPPQQPRKPQPKQEQRSEPRNTNNGDKQQQKREPQKWEKQRRNDSHSLFGERNVEQPALEDELTGGRSEAIAPPSIDDLVLEPIAVELDPMEIRPPRAKLPPPRRRRDTRTPDAKAKALAELKRVVSTLHGIGPKMAEKLETLEIRTVEELLFTFPRRYDDYTTMKPLNRLRAGELVSVIGTVRSTAVIKGKRNIDVFNVVIDDGTATMTAGFFNQPYLRGKMNRGDQVCFSGKTDLYLGRITMSNPHWEFVDQDALTTRAIVPVYPLTSSITAANMRKSTEIALDAYGDALPDIMPESVLDRAGLAEYAWAVRQMHRPESMDMLEHARNRLMFDDLILLQLGVLRNRREWQSHPSAPITVDQSWLEQFIAGLPFPLTGAQARSIQAIRDDIAKPIPMNRLLQGDVGAGKTVVAASALAMAAANGMQGALMAPTGILAEQHYRGLSRLFDRYGGGMQIRLLTSATSNAERVEILRELADGTVSLLIGTHALIQDDVDFARLGLVVVDEQHRFGVEQRGKLRNKGTNPHVLVMTATPIPRTLALTLYADLDLSVLDEMPPGRTPVKTYLLPAMERERVYRLIERQVQEGRQAFIVYPLVEASENEAMAEVKSAVEEFERLKKEIFPHLRLSLLHGRMSQAEKDAVMAHFGAGKSDVLISTAVVEVGIDVPNSTVMMIEGANRFGLAQLHQFRGRVGRGSHESFCILIPDADDEPNNPRLQALVDTNDGFKLAEIDWKLRGAGDLLGTRQSGLGAAGKLSAFMTPRVVELAQAEARALFAEDPVLRLPEHLLLRQRLFQIYGDEPGTELS